MHRPIWPFALVLLVVAIAGFGWTAARKAKSMPGTPLSSDQADKVRQSTDYIRQHGLTAYADLSDKLLAQGIWQQAKPDDKWIAGAKKEGNDAYAYTLSDGRHPSAIVLAAKFFGDDVTPAGRTSLMVHEMGHYNAYVRTGHSDEYDGYKAQYDAAKQLGLSESDGLVYFMMLDGVAENVVPRDPSYGKKPDVHQYMTSN